MAVLVILVPSDRLNQRLGQSVFHALIVSLKTSYVNCLQGVYEARLLAVQ